ncbi:hypothetical protein TOPH_02748 [Tolypocladium ophioglossoides CBS 100239]|uniref:Uncharacterized protein n=1 Tax=Tolypocladium ophioglossoides (strain CBS 100239) TaxID=1163406 RepID=A0A0L0NF59_TOLOC|nr:hypothetical protein TOPH_02748 [Tolypocladium ophioglossoides CBS 100239]
MHPTCLKAIGNDLVALEFAKGPTPLDASKIPTKFVREWADFLNKHSLTNLLTLDFSSFGKGGEPTTEVETVSVPRVRDLEARNSSPDQPAAGMHWNEATKPDGTNTHKVHVNSLTSSFSGKELLDALVTLGVIQAY